MDNSIEVQINGDASGLKSALADAQSAVSSFADVAGGVFAGSQISGMFSGITSGIESMVSQAVGTASDFQTYGNTMTGIIAGVSDAGESMGDSFAAGSAKAAASALEAQDALIKYNEKVTELQQNIKDLMTGSNITDAQQNFADKMASITEQIQAVQDNLVISHEDHVQKMNDTLSDMQDEHNNKVADRTEKQQQELLAATNDFTRAALQRKFDEQNKLEDDAYQRQYETKQKQLQRNVDEEDARAKEQANKKIETLQDELAKEQKLQDDQIAKLKEQNDKKIAMYKQELADEERAYQLSVAKREASGGGGGRSGLSRSMTPINPFDAFANQDTVDKLGSVDKAYTQLHNNVQNFALKSPFTIHDIEDADQKVLALGLSTEKLNPIIGNLAGTFHTSFATAQQAVLGALSGYPQMLKYEFGLSAQELEAANKGPIKSQEQLLEALNKVEAKKGYTKGIEEGLHTLPGLMSNVQDRVNVLEASFMGLDQQTMQPVKGGLFDTLYEGVKAVGDYMMTHSKEIQGFLAELGKNIAAVFTVIGPLVKGIADFILHHKELVSQIIIGMAIFGALIPILVAVGATVALLMSPIGGLIILITAIGLSISMTAAQFITNFNIIKSQWSTFTGFIADQISRLLGFLGNLASKAKDALSHLDPFAKHSPSLVDQVTGGVAVIKQQYQSLGNMQIGTPSLGGMGSSMYAPAPASNYSYQNINSPQRNATINNNFNIQGQENAVGFAEYIAMQLEQKGIV